MRRWKETILLMANTLFVHAQPLGLPPVPIPADNPQSDNKIKLGDTLFHDARFSADGKVSCSTCHTKEKAFTDHLPVSKGFSDMQGTRMGTRSAPTVINAAYYTSLFWDGRVPSLEEQSKFPPINPVEGGLHSWDHLVEMLKKDDNYVKAFHDVFKVKKEDINIEHFAKAIASFERTVISGDSKFDRYMYGGEKDALSDAEKRGLKVYLEQGRCVSCHTISQTHALFTDNKFHNIGVGFKALKGKSEAVASEYIDRLKAHKKALTKDKGKVKNLAADELVLSEKKFSELGRMAITHESDDMAAFKTVTLRNISKTAPYMHDGSLESLEDVVTWYNLGGKLKESDPTTPFLDGGMKPLDLSKEQEKDLVVFLKALTSPQYTNVKDEK